MRLTVGAPEAMEELGARIARRLVAGDLVALDGELGAGKTTLTRGLGAQLGVRGPVTSPTFVLARTHPREHGAPLVHVDAYRLGSAAELEDLDIDFDGSIVVVEWAGELLRAVTQSWLAVQIDHPHGSADPAAVDGTDFEDRPEPRTVTITGHGPRWSDLSALAPESGGTPGK